MGLEVGATVQSGADADIKPGNCLPLSAIPLGSELHNIELKEGNEFSPLPPFGQRQAESERNFGRAAILPDHLDGNRQIAVRRWIVGHGSRKIDRFPRTSASPFDSFHLENVGSIRQEIRSRESMQFTVILFP